MITLFSWWSEQGLCSREREGAGNGGWGRSEGRGVGLGVPPEGAMVPRADGVDYIWPGSGFGSALAI